MKRASLANSMRVPRRRGVVLLVMLSLLALFTVIAVTFVVASGHFRRGAAAASRVEQHGDPFEVLLQQALMQVVRGSNHPQSAIGPHSLLEDMYGDADAVVGRLESHDEIQGVGAYDVAPWRDNPVASQMLLKLNAGVSYGWDRKPGQPNVDDDRNGIVDDDLESVVPDGTNDVYIGNSLAYPPEMTSVIPGGPQIVDNVDNYYAGRVITFITGMAAGQSCYIVRSKIVGAQPGSLSNGDPASAPRTILFVTPPENGTVPFGGDPGFANGDRYVINGRAFNGTGFGSNLPLAKPSSGNNTDLLRLLSYSYFNADDGGAYTLNNKNVPIALTPNPVDAGYRQYLKNMRGMIDADEDYDAYDYQNMIVAHRQGSRVIAPSLHRPDLVNFFLRLPEDTSSGGSSGKNKLGFTVAGPQDRWTHIPPSVRRRIILRPDPADHYDYTQAGYIDPHDDANGFQPGEPFTDENDNNVYDPFEQYEDLNNNNVYDAGSRVFANSGFDAVNGPWDVDNDGDGVNDSIWVDIGLPVTTAPDGRQVKPLVAVMVLDMDGRINVNAHGSPKHYARIADELQAVVTDTNHPGGQWSFQPPQNPRPQHPRQTTEERYLAGAKAIAVDQQDHETELRLMTDTLFASSMFPEYQRSGLLPEIADSVRWATALEQYPDPGAMDWQAQWSSYYRVYTTYDRLGGRMDNREMGPWIEPAIGQGYSVADINPGILFASRGLVPSLGMKVIEGESGQPDPIVTNNRVNLYRQLLEGAGETEIPRPGRYGESHLSRPQDNPLYSAYPGLGIVPRAGTTHFPSGASVYPKSQSTGATDDNTPSAPNPHSILGNGFRDQFGFPQSGDFGSPGDFDSNGAIGVDLAGQPVYTQMGLDNETIDDPTELNLHRRYYPQRRLSDSTTTGGRGILAYQDAPFTPSEFERILRQRDPGSSALSGRMYAMSAYYDYERHTLTSEQWDVPCPHIAPTPELAGALRDLGLSLTHPSIGDLLRARFYLSDGATYGGRLSADGTARLATLAMRSFTINRGLPPNASGPLLQSLLDRKQLRLLAPDLGMGVRMDINRPFGNGRDDSSPDGTTYPQNGVVDEPDEWRYESVSYGTAGSLNFDGDLDGLFDTNIAPNGSNAALLTEKARQHFAKELYCLMMLLIDENYVMPLPAAVTAGAGVNTPMAPEVLPQPQPLTAPNTLPSKYSNYAQHWLTSRQIAQWAVNAVDFRDRDSIMTPFEFDADPFYDNDGDVFSGPAPPTSNDNLYTPVSNGTWDVDGDVDLTTRSKDDTNKPWRGVVWGVEYSDLLLTETLAWHDRRTQNHMDDSGLVTDTGGTVLTQSQFEKYRLTSVYPKGAVTTSGSAELLDPNPTGHGNPIYYDPHWDQGRVPQGSAFIELYCTGNPNNPMFPRELYNSRSVNVPDGPMSTVAITQNFLHLSRVATGTGGTNYPVWRLAISQGRVQSSPGGTVTLTQNDVAMRLALNPATCSLDPADAAFSLLPWANSAALNATDTSRRVTIERVVTFCNEALSVNSTVGLNMTSTNALDHSPGMDIFSSAAGNAEAQPADYIVVGPYRNAGIDNVTTIGRTTSTGITVDRVTGTANKNAEPGMRPQPLISLNANGFLATSPDGSDQYPVYGGNPAGGLGTAVYVNSSDTGRAGYRQIRRPVTIACRTTGTMGSDIARDVGLNISEPNNIDRPSIYNLTGTNLNGPVQFTLRTTTYVKDNMLNTVDRIYAPNPDADDPDDDEGWVDDKPWDGYMEHHDDVANIYNKQLPRLDDHTTLRYKNVFLQRLANPLVAWHRYTNPYITLDWMPLDLTVMNAEPWVDEATHITHLREPGNMRVRQNNPGNNDDYHPNGKLSQYRVRFGSRQRGAPRYPYRGNFSYFNLWGQPNYLNPYDPSLPADSPGQGDPGGPPMDMDTRPPLTMRVSDKANINTGNNYYGLTPYNYVLGTTAPTGNNLPDNEFFTKWQDPLIHTLGYINESYHYRRREIYGRANATIGQENDPQFLVADPTVRPVSRNAPNDDTTHGWLMECDFINPSDPVNPQQYLKYIGAPWRPYGWLTCNNRPYASAGELMLVPCSSPARLGYEYDMRRTSLPASDSETTTANSNKAPWERSRSANHYLPKFADTVNSGMSPGAVQTPGYVNRAPYGHLLNFFESSTAGWSPLTPPPENNLSISGNTGYTASNFYRLLEFVHVPSRFSGTRRAHVHTTFNNSLPRNANDPNTWEAAAWPFVAPFNSYPTYREPGRVNINTMPHYGGDPSAVWRSVTNNFFPTRRYQLNTRYPRYEIHDDDGKYQVDRYVGYASAQNVLNGNGNNHERSNRPAPWNPSQDNRASYHNLVATMRSDNPNYDPRGADQLGGNGGDLYGLPIGKRPNDASLSGQHDPTRPALISNPFRSYMEGFTTVPTIPELVTSAASSNPMLAVDATLMRRRDMTWHPFNLVSSFDRQGKYNIDPAFDPLFALNFPRPYVAGQYDGRGGNRPFSGYTANMFYRWGKNDVQVAGIDMPFQSSMVGGGPTLAAYDNYHSRAADYRNTDRNPFFRYQLYTKLSNLVTTRSNVYAIWVTLGYFEVERVKVNGPQIPSQESTGYNRSDDLPSIQRWPSGYRLIREMGADTGEIVRHKAFALFDRTIPVGFVRGENFNVDRAFLTRRILY